MWILSLFTARVHKISMTGLLLLIAASLHGTTDLSKIPDQDKECLTLFFQHLLYKSPMGYTLFGGKPISLVSYPDSKSCNASDLGQFFLMEKGWETWARYQSLFPSREFVLKKERSVRGANTIILISKTQTLAAIAQNLDLFKKKFGQEFRPEELFGQMCDTNEPLFDYLGEEALIGILLGFGRTNGILFSRECEITDYLQAQLTPPFSCLNEINQLNPESQEHVKMHLKWTRSKEGSPSSSGSLEELHSIVNKRGFFELPGDDGFLVSIGAPRFVDYGEEPELVDSYIKTRNALRKAYQKDPFLQVTLSQWTNPQFPGEVR
jgi:hypothetical protein